MLQYEYLAFDQKVSLPKVPRGKPNFHDIKFIFLAEDLVFFYRCIALTFKNLKAEYLTGFVWKNKFVMDNSFDIEKSEQHYF
jgi:hypothetical protein